VTANKAISTLDRAAERIGDGVDAARDLNAGSAVACLAGRAGGGGDGLRCSSRAGSCSSSTRKSIVPRVRRISAALPGCASAATQTSGDAIPTVSRVSAISAIAAISTGRPITGAATAAIACFTALAAGLTNATITTVSARAALGAIRVVGIASATNATNAAHAAIAAISNNASDAAHAASATSDRA